MDGGDPPPAVHEEEEAPEPCADVPATAAAKEKKHWSGVAYGAPFQQTFGQLGARKDQSIMVRLQRDETHGRSISLEPSFAWTPVARADCKQQLEQCVRGANGAALVKEKLNPNAKKQKQVMLSFKKSSQTPPPQPNRASP
eukprot:scaffold58637_cov63-Phaeocystis_antarctica.AAC.1